MKRLLVLIALVAVPAVAQEAEAPEPFVFPERFELSGAEGIKLSDVKSIEPWMADQQTVRVTPTALKIRLRDGSSEIVYLWERGILTFDEPEPEPEPLTYAEQVMQEIEAEFEELAERIRLGLPLRD